MRLVQGSFIRYFVCWSNAFASWLCHRICLFLEFLWCIWHVKDFPYKPHLLITCPGVWRGFALAPAERQCDGVRPRRAFQPAFCRWIIWRALSERLGSCICFILLGELKIVCIVLIILSNLKTAINWILNLYLQQENRLIQLFLQLLS